MNQLLCTLRFLATGSQLITCGDMIGVHESTACRIVHRAIHAIASLYHSYIKFPNTVAEQNKLASDFYRIAKFPRVNGAIDCTHVRIQSPGGENAEIFRNRKGHFSVNTQCVAGPNLTFLDVVARWQGSAHDSNIWDNSALKRNFVQGAYGDKLLLGDSGYAQTHYMMTPLADGNVHTRGERLYQEAQIKTRNVVERTFGVWKRRFPILSRGINVNINRVPGIIVATAVLHNLAILQNDDVPPGEDDCPVFVQNEDLATQQQRGRGNNLERRILIDGYFSSL